jgi:hypothetical protein
LEEDNFGISQIDRRIGMQVIKSEANSAALFELSERGELIMSELVCNESSEGASPQLFETNVGANVQRLGRDAHNSSQDGSMLRLTKSTIEDFSDLYEGKVYSIAYSPCAHRA